MGMSVLWIFVGLLVGVLYGLAWANRPRKTIKYRRNPPRRECVSVDGDHYWEPWSAVTDLEYQDRMCSQCKRIERRNITTRR